MSNQENNLQTVFNNYDLYNVLGLDKKCELSAIKRKYYELSRECHPDKGGDAEKFYIINIAYKILYNEENRKKYDAEFHRDKFDKIKEDEDVDIDYKDLKIEIDDSILDKLKRDFNKTYEEMVKKQFLEFRERPISENLKEYNRVDSEIKASLAKQKKINPGKIHSYFEKKNEEKQSTSTEIMPFNQLGGAVTTIQEWVPLEAFETSDYGFSDETITEYYGEEESQIDFDRIKPILTRRERKMDNSEMKNKLGKLKTERNSVRFGENTINLVHRYNV
jgi:curved DNA-binding protein CbpA